MLLVAAAAHVSAPRLSYSVSLTCKLMMSALYCLMSSKMDFLRYSQFKAQDGQYPYSCRVAYLSQRTL